MAKVIVIGAAKGGVGKTVTTFNLAYALAAEGRSVLAVDFDSQSNLTTCFGAEGDSAPKTDIGDLMMAQLDDEKLPDAEKYIMTRGGVDFIGASMKLSAVEAKLRFEMGAEKMLSGILKPLRERYDYILIDTCPALGALTINALAAADRVIITVNPQLLAMKGLQDFLAAVKKIRCRINSKLRVEGILLTMCEKKTNLCRTVSEQICEAFQGKVRIFGSRIPNTVKVGESVYYTEPLTEYAPGSNACRAYRKLAEEIIAYEEE